MPFDHEQAVEEHLAERYVLCEMSDAEAEIFEQHFFECAECASAVDAGQTLVANGREVVREAPQAARNEIPEPRRISLRESLMSWWSRPAGFVPVAAALVLGAVVIYQNAVVIPGLRQMRDTARVIPAFQLIAASRGDVTPITVARDASSFAVSADIPPDAEYPKYICELISGGRTIFNITVDAAGQSLTILVPARQLNPGVYELTITGVGADGQKRERVSVFPFNLQFN